MPDHCHYWHIGKDLVHWFLTWGLWTLGMFSKEVHEKLKKCYELWHLKTLRFPQGESPLCTNCSNGNCMYHVSFETLAWAMANSMLLSLSDCWERFVRPTHVLICHPFPRRHNVRSPKPGWVNLFHLFYTNPNWIKPGLQKPMVLPLSILCLLTYSRESNMVVSF